MTAPYENLFVRTYLIAVDYSWMVKHGRAINDGVLVISVPALGGLTGPLAFATTKEEVPARARDLLIRSWRQLDDEYAYLAYMDIRWTNEERMTELVKSKEAA